MLERRQYIRFLDDATVILMPGDGSFVDYINADLTDISSTGIGVFAPKSLEIGEYVRFQLITKLSDSSIAGEGKVIYINEIHKPDKSVFRIGISFTKVEKETIRAILNIIQKDICNKARGDKT